MTNTYVMVMILIMGGASIVTRVLPFAVFTREKNIPGYILYLGDVLPYASMGLLVVYCLRNVNPFVGSHGIPEVIAMAVVIISYLWKRNMILSIILSTVLYMVLIQKVFI